MNEEVIRNVVENVLKRLGGGAVEEVRGADERTLTPVDYFAPWTGEVFAASMAPRAAVAHPSQEQFSIGEAAEKASAVRELVEFLESEKCTIEKGKTCDHCGSCRTLGF